METGDIARVPRPACKQENHQPGTDACLVCLVIEEGRRRGLDLTSEEAVRLVLEGISWKGKRGPNA
jgi:hypothetical protein